MDHSPAWVLDVVKPVACSNALGNDKCIGLTTGNPKPEFDQAQCGCNAAFMKHFNDGTWMPCGHHCECKEGGPPCPARQVTVCDTGTKVRAKWNNMMYLTGAIMSLASDGGKIRIRWDDGSDSSEDWDKVWAGMHQCARPGEQPLPTAIPGGGAGGSGSGGLGPPFPTTALPGTPARATTFVSTLTTPNPALFDEAAYKAAVSGAAGTSDVTILSVAFDVSLQVAISVPVTMSQAKTAIASANRHVSERDVTCTFMGAPRLLSESTSDGGRRLQRGGPVTLDITIALRDKYAARDVMSSAADEPALQSALADQGIVASATVQVPPSAAVKVETVVRSEKSAQALATDCRAAVSSALNMPVTISEVPSGASGGGQCRMLSQEKIDRVNAAGFELAACS